MNVQNPLQKILQPAMNPPVQVLLPLVQSLPQDSDPQNKDPPSLRSSPTLLSQILFGVLSVFETFVETISFFVVCFAQIAQEISRHRILSHCLAKISHSQTLPHCLAKISHSQALAHCLVKISHSQALAHCLAKISYSLALAHCLAKISYSQALPLSLHAAS